MKAILKAAQKRQVKAYNKKHKATLPFEVGEKVWLLRCYMRMKWPLDKLNDKWLEPFEIKEVISHNARRLKLPKTIQIHLFFYISLLEPYNDQELEWPAQMQSWPIEVDSKDKWEVEKILDSRLRKM